MATQTTELSLIVQKLCNSGLIAEVCPSFVDVRLTTREVYPNEVAFVLSEEVDTGLAKLSYFNRSTRVVFV
jgi:uncharacterized protein YwgA